MVCDENEKFLLIYVSDDKYMKWFDEKFVDQEWFLCVKSGQTISHQRVEELKKKIFAIISLRLYMAGQKSLVTKNIFNFEVAGKCIINMLEFCINSKSIP